jgi:hypothetical protein
MGGAGGTNSELCEFGFVRNGRVQEHVHLGCTLCVSILGGFIGNCVGPDRVQGDQTVLVDQVVGLAILVWDGQDVVPTERLAAFLDVLEKHVNVLCGPVKLGRKWDDGRVVDLHSFATLQADRCWLELKYGRKPLP